MALKRYRYRAYPTSGQARMLARTFGSCRVVFNDFVVERQRLYRAGLAETLNACGADVRLALASAVSHEAGTRRSEVAA